MSPSSEITHRRARLAGLTKNRPAGDPDIDDARRDLKATRAEEYIRRLVDEAPPLTPDQRNRLAAILRPVQRREAA